MAVTIRKKREWRYLLRFLTILELAAAAMLWWMCAQMRSPGAGALLFGLLTVPVVVLLWRFERWSVTFSREGIRWKGQLRPWSQVVRVRESRSATERMVLSVHFRDGRVLRFRMEEENAEQARRMICRHGSIEV